MKFLVDTTKRFFATSHLAKIFIIGCVIYAIALAALIRADVYYMDDWKRSFTGNGFMDHSRYSAHKFFRYINVGMDFVDISPLTQFLSIFLLVASSLILLFSIRGKFDIVGIIAALPLGLSPFYLENLSYKFDNVGMSFSIFFVILPFLFRKNLLYFALISAYCLILMYGFYQASNSIYIVVCAYFTMHLYFVESKRLKDSALFALAGFMSFVVGTLIYQHFIVDYTVATYVYTQPFALRDLWSGILHNLTAYLSVIYDSVREMTLFTLCLVIFALFPLCFASLSRKKIIAVIFAIVFVALGICLSFGAYLALQMPLFYARAFMGIGALVALLQIVCVSAPQRILRYVSITFATLIGYSLIVFATAYGNALKAQDNYASFRNATLAQDLAKFISDDKQVGFEMKGEIGYAPAAHNFISVYKDIGENLIRASATKYPRRYDGSLAPQTPGLFWNFSALYHLGISIGSAGLNQYPQCQGLNQADSTLLVDNLYHTISQNNQCFIITLKSPLSYDERTKNPR